VRSEISYLVRYPTFSSKLRGSEDRKVVATARVLCDQQMLKTNLCFCKILVFRYIVQCCILKLYLNFGKQPCVNQPHVFGFRRLVKCSRLVRCPESGLLLVRLNKSKSWVAFLCLLCECYVLSIIYTHWY